MSTVIPYIPPALLTMWLEDFSHGEWSLGLFSLNVDRPWDGSNQQSTAEPCSVTSEGQLTKRQYFHLGHSSGCLFWESYEEGKTYHTKRLHGKTHLERNRGIQPISSITYQAYKWMILKIVPALSFRATHLCPEEQRYAIHSLLFLFSLQGFLSRGPVIQNLKPRNHTGQAWTWREGMSIFCVYVGGWLNCWGQKAYYADCIFLHVVVFPIPFDHLMVSHNVVAPPTEKWDLFFPLNLGRSLWLLQPIE